MFAMSYLNLQMFWPWYVQDKFAMSQFLTWNNKKKRKENTYCHPLLSKPKPTSVKGIACRASSKKSTYKDTQSPLPSPTHIMFTLENIIRIHTHKRLSCKFALVPRVKQK